MYSGEALALFICYYNLFMSENCCKKKNSGFPEGSRSFFFLSRLSARDPKAAEQ